MTSFFGLIKGASGKSGRGVRLLTAGCALALMMGAAKTASASAYGYDYWGVHTFKDLPIPAGQLFGVVEGDGLRVRVAGGNFLSVGNLCNWKMDVDFIDASRRRYANVSTGIVGGCTHAAQRKFSLNRDMKEGLACVRLYTAFDHRVASVCHNITR